jgi:ribosome-binding factor A
VARSFPRSRTMGETVREVIARILVEQIADPRLDTVTLTGVEMSPDLRHANVFFTTHDDAELATSALAGLDSAKGRIRSLLGAEVRTRFVPELHFRLDPAIEEATRIADAINRERESGRVRDDEPDAEEGSGDDV